MEPIIIIFTIVLLGVLAVEILVRIVTQVKDIKDDIKVTDQHGLHDWCLNEKDEMICCICGKKAGTNG